ncbi:glycosyltransferase [Steroidobacter denitrificans]|nr:glycosyltransferase [Steroidobacter denitrificans]
MGWEVDVFCQRNMRDTAPTLNYRPRVHSRSSPPSRLHHWPPTSAFARRYQRGIEHRILSDFISSRADLYVHYRRPLEYPARMGALPGSFVYDCVDDWEGFGSGDAAQVRAWEQALCERADRIWVVSRRLQEKFAIWKDKISYVPNGVDYSHFARARDMRIESDARMPDKGRPRRLIYIGALQHWFDARLVGATAARLGGWEVQLVGSCQLDQQQRAYLARGNIRLLGRRDYQELPSLLAKADVAMIPFVMNDLIRGTNPIKLYEYLAAGVPVVASPMPEVLPYVKPGVVGCADDPAHFARLVEEFATAPNPDRCQAIARKCSWEARFLPVLEEVQSTL